MTPDTEISFEGQTQTINEWALDYGITPSIIIARLEQGDTIPHAITTPMKVGHPGQQLPAFHRKQRSKKARVLHVWPPIAARERGRPVKLFEFNGAARTLLEWAEVTGFGYSTLRLRRSLGWTIEEILTTPLKRPAMGRGVSSNFAPFEGTGGGSTAQETTEITFSEKARTA